MTQPPPQHEPTRTPPPPHRAKAPLNRAHRTRTERNLLLGFFALLFIVGGGLIWYFYGAGAAALGVACIAAGALLVGLLALLMAGLQWLSDRWEEK